MKINKGRGVSLRKRILITSVSALLLFAFVMGSIGVYAVGKLTKDSSEEIMMQLCEQETLRFNNRLNLVYHSVEMICKYAMELNSLNSDMNIYSENFQSYVKEFAVAVANETDGAMAVYFRYNPEITGSGTDGFLWTKDVNSGLFVEEYPTDILAYNPGDIEHVGWFYEPKRTGSAMWMAPYYNKNLDVFMISYIIPIYLSGGEFVGVVGMDIDFKTILNDAHQMNTYESGSIAMVDLKERLIYYADDENVVQTEILSSALYNHITTLNKFSELLEITDEDGRVSVICCKKLFNGMMIYINVPKKEINRNRDRLLFVCILVTAVVFVLMSWVIMNRTRHILYPMEKLTEITKKYTEGDWSEQYICDTGDEVQRLSEGIAQMAQTTQDYIARLSSLAHTDALTGIGNRTSYLEMLQHVYHSRKSEYDRYAVVAMDLNYLKRTNDTYGHEAGDALIKAAADYISSTFAGSAAFRIGGDEFVAILTGDDYDNREELIQRFADKMNQPLKDTPDVYLSISYGMALYPEDAQNYDSVFELADERMYIKKKEMKDGK